MAVPQEQQDFAFYWQLFKGNYIKGFNAFKGLLNIPQFADELITNMSSLSVIYPSDYTDLQERLLYDYTDNSEYGLQALNNYLGVLGVNIKPTFDETINDFEAMAQVAQRVAGLNAFFYSPKNKSIITTNQNAVKALGSENTSLDYILSDPALFTMMFYHQYNYIRMGFMRPEFSAKVYGYMSKTIPPFEVALKNLTNPFTEVTGDALPFNIMKGSLAVVGDYIYLYGGNTTDNTNRIMRASINAPTVFTDTGKTLPYQYCGGSLAIIDNYIYMYGSGYNSSGTTYPNATFTMRASIDDPTTFTRMGNLPSGYWEGSVTVAGDYIYLYGGTSSTFVGSTKIMRASISTPTTFTTLTEVLPYLYYGGACAVIGDYIYLYGNNHISGSSYPYRRYIMRASKNNPANFVLLSNRLPDDFTKPLCAILGDYIYLIGGNSTDGIGIYQAPLSNPVNFTKIDGTLLPRTSLNAMLAIIDDYVYIYGGTSTATNTMMKSLLTDLFPAVADLT